MAQRRASERHPLEYAAVVVAAASALFSAIAAGVSFWQASLMRQDTIVSQRAFVSVDIFSLIDAHDSIDKSPSVGIVVKFVNSGNTATKGFTQFTRCATSEGAISEPWSLLQEPNNIPERNPALIGPHSSTFAACAFHADEFAKIADGKLIGYILVHATYRDRVNEREDHQVQWAQQIVKVVEKNGKYDAFIQPAGKHNCADGECP